jgi:hypothetical protein
VKHPRFIPAVDANGLPFVVFARRDGTLNDTDGAFYAPFPDADDPDAFGYMDVADPQDVIKVPRTDYCSAVGVESVLRSYPKFNFRVTTRGRILGIGVSDEYGAGAARLILISSAAHDELGWDVFQRSDGTGIWEIEREDDLGKFDCDEDAIDSAVAFFDARHLERG